MYLFRTPTSNFSKLFSITVYFCLAREVSTTKPEICCFMFWRTARRKEKEDCSGTENCHLTTKNNASLALEVHTFARFLLAINPTPPKVRTVLRITISCSAPCDPSMVLISTAPQAFFFANSCNNFSWRRYPVRTRILAADVLGRPSRDRTRDSVTRASCKFQLLPPGMDSAWLSVTLRKWAHEQILNTFP